jgi:hypothetical protein
VPTNTLRFIMVRNLWLDVTAQKPLPSEKPQDHSFLVPDRMKRSRRNHGLISKIANANRLKSAEL